MVWISYAVTVATLGDDGGSGAAERSTGSHTRGNVLARLIGLFTVERDGHDVTGSLGSRKARALLKLLAVERGHVVPVDRVVDVLWGDERPQRPAENVATLVSRLRAVLGPAAIVGGRDGYRLGSAPAVRVDLDEALRHVAEAERRLGAHEPAFATVAAASALDRLGDGTALAEDPYADWAEPARTQAATLLRRARHAAARSNLDTGDADAAAGLADAAIGADPADELAHRLLMRAHVQRGEPARALSVYERLRAYLAEDLGVDPGPQTRELHTAILRESAEPSTVDSPFPASPALAGRGAEQRRLEEAFAAATRGQGGLILVAGEAGIGKTSLAEQAIGLAKHLGATVLRARCYDAERSLFLQPIAELLSAVVARTSPTELPLAADRVAALASLLSDLLPEHESAGTCRTGRGDHSLIESGHADLERRRVFDAVAALLRGLAERAPVLVFLDDLHSAGLSTVEILHFLARNLRRARLLLLATIRVEEGGEALRVLDDVAVRLDLGPLPADAVRALAAEAGHADLADQILGRTRGHALYVTETLRGLRAGETGVPATLQSAVLSRVRRAGEPIEELLRAAAVVAATLDPLVLARLLGEPSTVVVRRCEEALAARLLAVAGREYEFANDLIREVLYATTPEPTRIARHLRAAELLDDRPEAVAEHAAAAGDWLWAARAFLVAGEQAMSRFAADDAHTLLDRALAAVARSGSDTVAARELAGRVHVARAWVRESRKQYHEAFADLRDAVAAAHDAGDRRLEMQALLRISGDASIARGVPTADCVDNLEQAVRIAESLADRGAEAALLARLATLKANRLELEDALAYGRRALAAGRAAGDDRALAAALDGLKTPWFYLGEASELATVTGELEPILRGFGDLFTLQWTVFESSFIPFAVGDWDEARRRMELAVELNQRSGFTAYRGWFTAHLCLLDRLLGRLEPALEQGRRAVAMAQESPPPLRLPRPLTQLGATLLAVGGRDEAIALLDRARASAGIAPGPSAHLPTATALLAEATGSAELLDEADAMLAGVTAPAGSAWLYGFES